MTEDTDAAAPIEAVRSLRAEYEGLDRAAAQAGRAITRALTGGVTQGRNFESVLQGVGKRLIEIGLRAALKPLENLFTQGLGNLFGGTGAGAGAPAPFANGGVFRAGRVTPFAQGGVVSAPTYFPMAGGTGLMGEAGPEAILPLARGADGRLGVRGAGSGPVQVTLNITTPDAESFRRSEAQVAAALARAMARGRRAL